MFRYGARRDWLGGACARTEDVSGISGQRGGKLWPSLGKEGGGTCEAFGFSKEKPLTARSEVAAREQG